MPSGRVRMRLTERKLRSMVRKVLKEQDSSAGAESNLRDALPKYFDDYIAKWHPREGSLNASELAVNAVEGLEDLATDVFYDIEDGVEYSGGDNIKQGIRDYVTASNEDEDSAIDSVLRIAYEEAEKLYPEQ